MSNYKLDIAKYYYTILHVGVINEHIDVTRQYFSSEKQTLNFHASRITNIDHFSSHLSADILSDKFKDAGTMY